MRKPKLILISAILLMGGTVMFAQGGQEALPFMRIDRDPATAAMGGAGTASTESIAYSAFKNTSVIPFSQKTFDIAASFQNWAPDAAKTTNVNFGFGAKAGKNFGFALGFATQSGQKYDVMSETGSVTGDFTPKDFVINGGFGVAFTEKIGMGLTARYASQKIAKGVSFNTVAFDALLYFKPAPEFGLTAGVASIGGKIKDESGKSFDIPSSVHAAGDYTTSFEKNSFKAVLDLDYYLSGNVNAALGAQYGYNDLLFVRAGYHIGGKEAVLPTFATVGAGIKFYGVNIDVAYLTANDYLGNTITIGIGYSF